MERCHPELLQTLAGTYVNASLCSAFLNFTNKKLPGPKGTKGTWNIAPQKKGIKLADCLTPNKI